MFKTNTCIGPVLVVVNQLWEFETKESWQISNFIEEISES